MDSPQRSADRRRLLRIAIACLIGLLFIVVGAISDFFGLDEGSGRRSYPSELGYLFGAGWIGAGLFELARRLMTGPSKPGKRARY